MEFYNILQENQNDNYYLEPYWEKLKRFDMTEILPGIWLSIQAGFYHFCKPHKNLRDLTDYTHWEFALYDQNGFLKVRDILPNFRSLAEVELYENEIYTYVPTDLVEELYTALKQAV